MCLALGSLSSRLFYHWPRDAVTLGSYPISILPDEDCCTLFTPRHPSTRARPAGIDEAERALPLTAMIDGAAAAPDVERVAWPVVK